MHWIGAIVGVLLSGAASAQAVRRQPSGTEAAIDRGLAFLAKDALAWKAEHNCVSCHHAALVVWSMREAKQRGHAVDEPVLAELTKWVAESGDGKTGVREARRRAQGAQRRRRCGSRSHSAPTPKPDAVSQKGLKLLLKTVKGDQTENGSWSSWPETRPPIFGNSDESMTALATLAVLPAAATGDDAAKAVRDKGVKWLAETKTDDDPQSIAMRLVLWKRLGRPAEEWEPLVRRIKERQNADGGWSQAKDMASDAWATGQALYALAHAGIKPDEPVIARAPRLPDQDAARRRLLADDFAADQTRGRRVNEPDPDHRRRQRLGGAGAGAEPVGGRPTPARGGSAGPRSR